MNSRITRSVLQVGLAIALVLGGSAMVEAKSGRDILTGTNVFGRTGLLFSDTAQVPDKGRGAFVASLLYGSGDDVDYINLPFGGNYGVADNFELSASVDYLAVELDLPPLPASAAVDDEASGLNRITVGGKYRIPASSNDMPDFAVGLDISNGPMEDDLGDSGTDINLKGMATFKVRSDLLVNGGLGILLEDDRNGVDGDNALQLNGGAAYKLRPDLAGIVELSINGRGEDDGVLAGGVRGRLGSGSARFHALLGLGIGSDAADFILGTGVQLPF